MESMRNIVLDFCRNSYQAITVKQYDKDSRVLRISCTNYGADFLADKATMRCNVKMSTPDNRNIYDVATINDDGTITVVFTENMLFSGGKGKLELQFIDVTAKQTLSTMILDVIIVSSVYPDDAIIASDEFNALTDTIIRAENAVKEAEEVVQEMTDLEENIKQAESERVIAENKRNQNELDRINLESARVDNEHARVAAEIARVEAENKRVLAETDRVINEDDRKDAEAIRVSNETIRQNNETTRVSQEDARQANEQIRIANEDERKTAESTRVSNEDKRVLAETSRVSAEDVREANEAIRIQNELDRQSAETLRETNTSTAIANAEVATERANNAAKACEDIIVGTGFISSAEKGTAGGVATLDNTGKITSSQLPDNIGGDIVSTTQPETVNCFWMQEY